MDKRDRAAMFRDRLTQAMALAGESRAGLARATGADRSTLSQLLAEGDTRLPNAHLVAECARALAVSADWLLGLTDRPERPGDLIAGAVRVAKADRALVDEHILAWHQEARGYKIRHVPATLPDMLKTEDVISWEYDLHIGKTPEQALRARLDGLDWLRNAGSDYEIALPRHEIEAFAAGEGYYKGLCPTIRREQIRALRERAANFFPSLRIFLFDARRLYSAPLTIFGPIMGVIYVGHVYLAFRSEDRVRSLTQHFDWLVRECDVDARDLPAFLDGLIDT